MTPSPKPEISIKLTALQSLSVIVASQEVDRLQRQAATIHDEIFGEIAREHHAEIAEFVASPEVAPLRSTEGVVGLRILRIEDHEGKPARIVFGVAQSPAEAPQEASQENGSGPVFADAVKSGQHV